MLGRARLHGGLRWIGSELRKRLTLLKQSGNMANAVSDRQTHVARVSEEMKAANEQADSLERTLPNLPNDETKRKIELVIQSYRLHANRLSEHIRDEAVNDN